MSFCPCVSELLVKDLNTDFQHLMDPGKKELVFRMGEHVELNRSAEWYKIAKGHEALHELMSANASEPFYRKPGRLTVWIANHIEGHQEGTHLAGTTYLDHPLFKDLPGAGVLLGSQASRASHLLSHEVGHVVGFHHAAGLPPGSVYRYHHKECSKDQNGSIGDPKAGSPGAGSEEGLLWPIAERPSCEVNIMGGWYDGPYCCPWKSPAGAAASSLYQLHSSNSFF